jgi:hypothetical protein
MRRRLTRAILLLYPRRVRNGHGSEIVGLIDDIVAHEGRSRARLFMRLALDGLVQRIATTTTAWTMAAVLALTSLAGLAASGFAAASAHQGPPRTVRTVAPAQLTHRMSPRPPRSDQTSRRSARATARRVSTSTSVKAQRRRP